MIPGKRKVVVDGVTYPYILKFGKAKYIGDTAPTIDLTVMLGPNAFLKGSFLSKLWTKDHAEDNCAPQHKNSFTPKDVVSVIKAQIGGKLPVDFDLPTWELTR